VADEVGVEGIRVLSEFQLRVKSLKEEGVLLALNTRNDRAVVEEVFRQRGDMVLRLEDFSAVEANWGSKADNLRAISERLGIGLDSLVFLDDTAQERAMVKAGAPEVFTPAMPRDAGLFDSFLAGLAEIFRQSASTEEDRRRTELYAAREEALALLEAASSREDGLRLLGMRADIKINDILSVTRLAQLTQKTNQFNLTTRRYSEEDIEGFIEDSNWMAFSLRLWDKFGNHGIVGLMLARKEGEDVYTIDTFALSCRALGRTVEQTFMAQVAKTLKNKGIKYIRGIYIPTSRNEGVKDFYEKLGFRKVREEGETTYWEFDLEMTEIASSPWVPTTSL
jgi:FkbH-like protein